MRRQRLQAKRRPNVSEALPAERVVTKAALALSIDNTLITWDEISVRHPAEAARVERLTGARLADILACILPGAGCAVPGAVSVDYSPR